MISVDGCFNHRHLTARGNCPPILDDSYFLSKEYVDKVGREVETARKTRKGSGRSRKKKQKASTKQETQPDESSGSDTEDEKNRGKKVPRHAVKGCERSHAAGSGSNVKTQMDQFDDAGLMAAVCRHDIPLFVCNIDTPGEQQKYAVALIKHVMSLIPDEATVSVLYDVGCVLDRSREKVCCSILCHQLGVTLTAISVSNI